VRECYTAVRGVWLLRRPLPFRQLASPDYRANGRPRRRCRDDSTRNLDDGGCLGRFASRRLSNIFAQIVWENVLINRLSDAVPSTCENCVIDQLNRAHLLISSRASRKSFRQLFSSELSAVRRQTALPKGEIHRTNKERQLVRRRVNQDRQTVRFAEDV
jgi:hypothetical protein